MKAFRCGLCILFLGAVCGFWAKTGEGIGEVSVAHRIEHDQRASQERAGELAIIDAIQSIYGTYAEQEATIKVSQGRESFSIIGTTKVLGEWVETTEEAFTEEIRPVTENRQTSYETWITCTITGKVRKATPKAAIRYQPLNCHQIHCRTTVFYSDESLYLYFESPVDGYLSVFLEEEQNVYRLFPYINMGGEQQSTAAIKGDQGYILFSNHGDDHQFGGKADEYLLYTTKPEEVNTLYILFSEKNYVKPGLATVKRIETHGQEILLPKSLGKSDFQQWLATNRAYDPSFVAVKVNITILSR